MADYGLHRPFLHILLIILLSLIAYSNTFHSPFQFDDVRVIVENPIIKDIQFFVEPSKAKAFPGAFGYDALNTRFIGYLTFALNYKIGGLDVTGYHIVNLLIHISVAVLIYFFILLSFRTPVLSESPLRAYQVQIAVFTALLFACHPVQTQAVTYIWQRVTSLAALLYMLSLTAYIKYRLINGRASLKSLFFYLICILSAVTAMKTKETAIMLPVTIVMYEFMFFKEKLKRRMLCLTPLLFTMLIIPLSLISWDMTLLEMAGDINEVTRGASVLPRWVYLITEFRVIITYIRLIFFPVGQNLDYDYPAYQSFFDTEVLLSFVFLVSLLSFSLYLYYRYRRTATHVRLISFGVFWFFINLLLESSIIPLNNVIFEHRLYLPSIGVFLAITTLIFMAVEKLKKRNYQIEKAVAAGLMIITLVLTGAAYARNEVWKDQKTLWEDVVKNSPDKPRGHIGLGSAYKSQGLIDDAIKQFEIAISLDPGNSKAHNNLGNAYRSQGRMNMALEQYKAAIKFDPDNFEAYNNIGITYKSQGQLGMAKENYHAALKLNPNYPKAHNNIGNIYKSEGHPEIAIKHYQTAINLDKDYAAPYINLGNVYMSLDSIDRAIDSYRTAVRLDPFSAEAHYNLAVAYRASGLIEQAEEHYSAAAGLMKKRK
ncbi:MAG TPA: tetratricopeptide repeat protein [Nitrospirae bacterium]|nr:photosystem I assembly protein Ycf3 [bacterium BMS3Abin10]GBE38308.1 photosystem I assembly protein Ycf3 [bacterium BMS3Bbin08]HDH49876.1 tetratricopeptide repeat protein [Nitrospirota bacterium]HDK81992.1 tetratricopeptide repeat protein [Nitrospirota bacterium]